MAKISESKACNACAKAKRRCGKQTPHCLRCRTRGISCNYPLSKPSNFILLSGEEEDVPVTAVLDFNTSGTSPPKSVSVPAVDFQPTLIPPSDASIHEVDLSQLPLSLELIGTQLASSWFAALDTWVVRFPASDANPNQLSFSDAKRFIKKIRFSLVEWISSGSNDFIHSHLYKMRFPRCIQDAYAALCCYVHKTERNELIAFRVVEDRATQLVEEYEGRDGGDGRECLDSLEHVARVQALLIYQMIGLYDGDIRLRHISETHIPILAKWMREMVQHSSQATCLGGSIISPQSSPQGITIPTAQNENLLWYSWILAESIRRTWVVGSGAQVIFLGVQRGSATPCDGGMMFTTRHGVWEARSAVEWEKLCMEVHIGLMQMAEADRLFNEVRPEDVNEFTKMVLDVTFGRERLERWGVKIDD
jgi:hypothetical protein